MNSARVMTVARLTDPGPRDENQDRAIARLHDDDSWLIAVIDGMGGHPRAGDAAETARRSLPTRISTPDEMRAAFGAANDDVAELTPKRLRYTFTDFHLCPGAVMCAAAANPSGETFIGYAGDTMPALIWRTEDGWIGSDLGLPHRRAYDSAITRYLGGPGSWYSKISSAEDYITLHTTNDIDMPAVPFAVVITSDGIWEPLLRAHLERDDPSDNPYAAALADCLRPDDHDADTIAHSIMTSARTAGLDDNATVAVAAIAERTASDAS